MKMLFVFLALILSSNLSHAQENKSSPDSTSKIDATAPLITEKVYLHFDRPYYASGDDIWFKAYLIDAFSNKLTDNSNCLYVELISPDSKILQRHVIRMNDGKGFGDFRLNNSLPSGKYQVRAYTNCMRNFGDYFFFKKEIQVENISGLHTAMVQPDSLGDKLDIQFFPEGGSLVEDVYSVVGFKAMNFSGTGCNIQGTVISSKGDTIAQFKSAHLGLGNFNFIPQSGMTYFAVGKTNQGETFKAQLPVFLKTGYVIKISEYDTGTLRLTIRTNQATLAKYPEQKLILIGTSHGKLCITVEIKVKNLITNIRIPRKEFPEGIARLTLADEKYRPLCERLVYFQRNQKINVSMVTDKKLYAPHEKVTMQIAAKDTNNHPVAINMSLAVIDASQVKTIEEYTSDICSYFLLESDIHGKIEQPAYYFDATKADRYKALDLLLLTQGWRDFVWKYLADSIIKHEYAIEKGISVSGKLQRLLTNKPIANANISLGLFSDNERYVNQTKTDSAGIYRFYGLDFTGEKNLVVSATNKNNMRQGAIVVDSLFGSPPVVDYKWNYKQDRIHKEITDFKAEAEWRDSLIRKYKFSDTILIEQVVIKAKKKITDDGHFRIYGEPDYSIKVTDQNSGYADIFQFLQNHVPGLQVTRMYPKVFVQLIGGGSRGTPLFLIDGTPVNDGGPFKVTQEVSDIIASLPVSIIDKVEVLEPGSLNVFGSNGGNGVISIFTKNGLEGSARPVYSSNNKKVYGYYPARTFYSPKYETPETQKPDLRTTIHWDPNIITDVSGKATITFYNADKPAVIQAKIEGITESGIPVTGGGRYEVRPQTLRQ